MRFLYIIAAYFLALVAAAVVYLYTDGTSFWRILYADVAATLVIFVFSYMFRNSSFYDAYWSVAPIVIAVTLLSTGPDGNFYRELLVLGLVTLWGLRLTANWAYGWRSLQQEDWRYIKLHDQLGLFYWPVSLLGIHLFPTAIVFLGCVPLFAVFSETTPLNVVDLIAAVITLSAIGLEAEADRELHRFRAARTSSEEILNTGVWAWCRHPNYLGEIGFWIGIFLFGYSTLGGATDLMKAGPIVMLLLFLIVSIPMITARLEENKPRYVEHRTRSYALLPFSRWRR